MKASVTVSAPTPTLSSGAQAQLPCSPTGDEWQARWPRSMGGRAMRLVAVRGMGLGSDVEASRDAGIDAHLTKPVAAEVLERLASEGASNVTVLDTLHQRNLPR
jgi:hypothetical protein